MAVSFIGGGNRSTWRKSQTCRKSLKNFIIYCCIEDTLPWTRFELKTSVVIGTDCTCSCKSNYHTITITTVLPFLMVNLKISFYISRVVKYKSACLPRTKFPFRMYIWFSVRFKAKKTCKCTKVSCYCWLYIFFSLNLFALTKWYIYICIICTLINIVPEDLQQQWNIYL